MDAKNFFGDNVLTTRVDDVVNWGRKYSLWPLPYGTACCAIEVLGPRLCDFHRVNPIFFW